LEFSRSAGYRVGLMPPVVESPCTKVCLIDTRLHICAGCGRTMPEIAEWLGAPDARKRQILTQLPARLTALPLSRHGVLHDAD
jgi:uncharacterized protein